MRKTIIPDPSHEDKTLQSRWLDLEHLARVELSSEDPEFPIESALRSGTGPGWLAAQPGPQMIRVIFDEPIRLRQIYLEFLEQQVPRTQEFVLRWSPDQGRSYREIVRQQYNFTPPGTTNEREEYQLNLAGVTVLELHLIPDLGGSQARASLSRLLLA